jgi:hypothetical protein
MGKKFFCFRKLAGEVIFLKFGKPPAHHQPPAESGYVILPDPVPLSPALSQVVEIEEKYRERKDAQSYLKHVLESVEPSHD